MRNLFAIVSLSVTALTAACGASSHPKNNAAPDSGGMFDGAAKGDGVAGAKNDTAYGPESGGDVKAFGVDAGTVADVSSTGGAGGTGGRIVVGTGGSGGAAGSDALAPKGGAEGSDGPLAQGGTSPTDGPAATGGTGGGGIAGTASTAGTTGTAGITSAAGTSGSAGKTATAGSSGTAGKIATASSSGSAGKTATAGSSGSAGTSGGGGSTGIAGPADNVAQLSVDFGLPNIGYVNGLFVTITVCVPGTSQCQTVDHVLVDTGSTGLRVLKSVLTLSLPAWTNDSGVALAECFQFVSGYTWGPLRKADLKIAGEQANGLAIQVIEESTYPVPGGCTGTDNSTADTLRANGIIGISALLQDCGSYCAATPGSTSANPGMYHACSSAKKGGCLVAAVPLAKQVLNPVSFFSQDNNGTIIELPTISANGAPSVTGALVFGIGTRDNNDLGQATVLQLDGYGEFLTKYPTNGKTSFAFIDSGSNALYFATSGSTRITTCAKPYSGFYCPSSTQSLSATIQDASGLVTVNVDFSIANAVSLFSHVDNVAYYNLGGTSAVGGSFDWGLPFYFGRNVFTSIEGQSTPAGAGPFVAF
jgi:hypothetical protein